MSFQLPEELLMLRETISRFVQKEMIPLESKYPEAEDIPAELRASLEAKTRAAGVWALDAPAEYGGAGLGYLAMVIAAEEFAQTVLVPSAAKGIYGEVISALTDEGTPEQKDKYLRPLIAGKIRGSTCITEPHTGSDPASMRTRAVRDGGHWVINGQKTFITRAHASDFHHVYASTDPSRGARGVTCFLVDHGTPGFNLIGKLDLLNSEKPGIISIENVRVPDSARLGEVGGGFRLAQQFLNKGRLRYAARALGQATRALRMATEYSKERVTFGQPLSERQTIQNYLADAAIELHAGRLMLYHAAWRHDQGQDIRQEAAMAKYFCCEAGFRAVDRALQVFGAAGLTRDLPIEQMFRDIRTWRILEGTSEILRMSVARSLLTGQFPGPQQFA